MNAIKSVEISGSTITVKANINEMATYKPTDGDGKNQERLYFALKLNLGVKRENLYEDEEGKNKVNNDAKNLETEWGIKSNDQNTFVKWVGFTPEEMSKAKTGSTYQVGDKMTREFTLYEKVDSFNSSSVYTAHTYTIVLEQVAE